MQTKFLIPIVILIAGSWFFYSNVGPTAPEGFIDMSATEARPQLEANPDVIILDIRTPQEYNQGHLEGAVNIDFYEKNFAFELDKLNKDKQYFVYCRTGNRSSKALRKMVELGFQNVWHMDGGIVDWYGSGQPVVQ